MSREIVTRIAYLIGVRKQHLKQFNIIALEEIEKSKECLLIRQLCQLRTILLMNYYDIDRALNNQNGKISDIAQCSKSYDNLLNLHGIDFNIYNGNTKDYLMQTNAEIEKNIDFTRSLFPSTVNDDVWKYIRNLFIIADDNIQVERKKFKRERQYYPFTCYISWIPTMAGNILDNDIKFLTILFSNNGKTYEVPKEELITNIYTFSEKCKKVIVAVDCENVDFSSFYTALTQFKPELFEKIDRIVLFDDSELKSGWYYYHSALPIEFERIECPRITANKSTLDVKMASYITVAHYRDCIDGIILVSSDSDYWGLIDTIGASAKFYILGESQRISSKNTSALDNNRIPYSLLDDFNDNEIRKKIKEETYKNEIQEVLNDTKFNIDFFMNIFQNQLSYFTEEDKELFRRVACGIKLSFDENGNTIYKF